MNRPSIFICHSSSDKQFVRQLTNKLKLDGIETWFDEVEIKIGDQIHSKINEGLKKSDFFGVVLSRESVKSKWVENELNSASTLEKYKTSNIFILPLLIEDCDVPPLLLDKRYANFKEDFESAYKELTDSIFYHFQKLHPEFDLSKIRPVEVDKSLLKQIATKEIDIDTLSPRGFEDLIAQLFHKLDYSVELPSFAKDGGVDIVASKEITRGLKPHNVVIECKRFSKGNLIGSSFIRSLLGVMFMRKVDRGILVTNSYFTREAIKIAQSQPLELIDRDKLYELISQIKN
jgi:HJR/Mrr/RecB family endonuclease